MKIIYVCHPISGDIPGNLEKIRQIVRHLNLTHPDIVPFAPYWLDCHALDDSVPEERQRGIANGIELIKRCVDEVWVYGDRISKGVQAEIDLANELKIPVRYANK